MYLCENGNTPSIYTLKPINKYTIRSKNVLFKPICKKNFSKCKLSYHGPRLWNIFITPNNELSEAVTKNMFKIRLKRLYLQLHICELTRTFGQVTHKKMSFHITRFGSNLPTLKPLCRKHKLLFT